MKPSNLFFHILVVVLWIQVGGLRLDLQPANDGDKLKEVGVNENEELLLLSGRNKDIFVKLLRRFMNPNEAFLISNQYLEKKSKKGFELKQIEEQNFTKGKLIENWQYSWELDKYLLPDDSKYLKII